MVLGGGQDASAVTTTDHRAGKFEAKFFDKVKVYFFSIICNDTSHIKNKCKLLKEKCSLCSIRFFKKK